MTRDDIIRMARESGLASNEWVPNSGDEEVLTELSRFAELAAAHEREACANVCEDMGRGHGSAFAEFDCAAAIRARGNT